LPKFRKHIVYEPQTALEEIIARVVADFRVRLNVPIP
jgi:hypothetical protein